MQYARLLKFTYIYFFIRSFVLFIRLDTRCTFKPASQLAYQNPNHTIISCASYSDFKTAISWIACAKAWMYVCERLSVCLSTQIQCNVLTYYGDYVSLEALFKRAPVSVYVCRFRSLALFVIGSVFLPCLCEYVSVFLPLHSFFIRSKLKQNTRMKL